jgi:hypothetical protein
MRFERFAAVSCALVEIVIGAVVLRAGSDVEPDHLAINQYISKQTFLDMTTRI